MKVCVNPLDKPSGPAQVQMEERDSRVGGQAMKGYRISQPQFYLYLVMDNSLPWGAVHCRVMPVATSRYGNPKCL